MGLFPAPLRAAVLVRTTVGRREDAERLARRLVDGRLAACAHVTEAASVYRWEGKVRQETEFLVEARTTPAGRGALVEAMADGHPYDEPLVESWTATHLPRGYASWMRGEVG